MLADERNDPTTTDVFAHTARSRAEWVSFDQVPKDPVVSLMCQKNRFMLYRGGAKLAKWRTEPVKV